MKRYTANTQGMFSKPYTNALKGYFALVVLLAVALAVGVLYLKFKTVFFAGEYLLKILMEIVILAFLFTATYYIPVGRFVTGRFLGNISYEVYISQFAVMASLSFFLPSISSHLFILLAVCVTIVLSFLLRMLDKLIVDALRFNGVKRDKVAQH